METKATDSKAVMTDQTRSSTTGVLRRPRGKRRNQAELQFHEKSEERTSVHRNMEDLMENSNSGHRNADLDELPAIAASSTP